MPVRLSDELPPELVDHWRKIATPANLAMHCSRGEWKPAKHLLYLNRKVVRALTVRDDPQDQAFLNVQASVRHGKSQLLTVWTSFWYLGMNKGKRILIVCATDDLAKRFSRQIRELMKEYGPVLFGKTVSARVAAEQEWETTDGNLVLAMGVGGNPTGVGFDVIFIDDPIANADQARSDTQKRNQIEWYSMTLRTRLQPGGTMLFTMARWAEDDLSGSIVERADGQEGADPWEVVKMPAIAEAPRGADDDWTDEIGRKEGDALWPEMWSERTLLRIKASLPDPRAWDALYQQNPTPPTGNMFDRERWGKVSERPAEHPLQLVRFWDLAATEKRGSDWTVGLLMGKYMGNRMLILDVNRFRGDPGTVEQEIRTTADVDGPTVKIRLEQEKAGAGKLTKHHYSNWFPDRDFDTRIASGEKKVRAENMASAQKRGMIDVLDSAHWAEELYREYEKFPNGRFDDQVDAGSGAHKELWSVDACEIALPGAFISRGMSVVWNPDAAKDLGLPPGLGPGQVATPLG